MDKLKKITTIIIFCFYFIALVAVLIMENVYNINYKIGLSSLIIALISVEFVKYVINKKW